MMNHEDPEGMLIDLVNTVCSEAGLEAQFIMLPNSRLKLYFRQLVIHGEPGINPQWRADSEVSSVYSISLLSSKDIIMMSRDKAVPVTRAEDLNGMSIACGRGYFYTEGFSDAMEAGAITRYDSENHLQSLLMLQSGRADAIIIDYYTAFSLIKSAKIDSKQFSIVYHFRETPLHIRLHHTRRNLLPLLNSAIKRLESRGVLKKIIRSYLE